MSNRILPSVPRQTLTPMKGESLAGWYYRLETAPGSSLVLPRYRIHRVPSGDLEAVNFHEATDEVISVTGVRREIVRKLFRAELQALQPVALWVPDKIGMYNSAFELPTRDPKACQTCVSLSLISNQQPTLSPEHNSPCAISCAIHGTQLQPVSGLRPLFFKISSYAYGPWWTDTVHRNHQGPRVLSSGLWMAQSVATLFNSKRFATALPVFDKYETIGAAREAVLATFYLLAKRRPRIDGNIGNTLIDSGALNWVFPTFDEFELDTISRLDVERKAVCLNIIGQFVADPKKHTPIDLLDNLDRHVARFINRYQEVPHEMGSNLLILLAELVLDHAPAGDGSEIDSLFPNFSKRWNYAVEYVALRRS